MKGTSSTKELCSAGHCLQRRVAGFLRLEPIGLWVPESVRMEGSVELIKCSDVIHVSSDTAACSICASGLFAIIRTYFRDTGEPTKTGIDVGCTHCDEEVYPEVLEKVREWVCSNYRVQE